MFRSYSVDRRISSFRKECLIHAYIQSAVPLWKPIDFRNYTLVCTDINNSDKLDMETPFSDSCFVVRNSNAKRNNVT